MLSLFYGVSFNRNFIFRDNLSLYINSEKKFPGNVRVIYNLAVAYGEYGNWEASNKYFEKVLKFLSKELRLSWLMERTLSG